MARSDGTSDIDFEESEPDSRARDVLTSALREGHKWLFGVFFAWAFYYAYVQPEIAISAAVVEGGFALLSVVLLAWAVRSTTERADTVEAV